MIENLIIMCHLKPYQDGFGGTNVEYTNQVPPQTIQGWL